MYFYKVYQSVGVLDKINKHIYLYLYNSYTVDERQSILTNATDNLSRSSQSNQNRINQKVFLNCNVQLLSSNASFKK